MMSLWIKGIFIFIVVFVLVERVGLFSPEPVLLQSVLYSVPLLSASVILCCMVLMNVYRQVKSLGVRDWLVFVAVLLMIIGLWVSFFTRCSVDAIITEGQTFTSNVDEYLPGSSYFGRLAKMPDFSISLQDLSPEFAADNNGLKRLRGSFSLLPKGGKAPTGMVLTDPLPTMKGGMFFSIKDFGFSPRYVLRDNQGQEVDSAFVYLRLFPQGREDYFRLLAPHTFYLKYYPQGNGDSREPLFRLRVVRNKDIVVNQDLHMQEEVSFDNGKIAFAEVRRWTKLTITRDYGLLLAVSGFFLAAGCAVSAVLGFMITAGKKPAAGC